MPQLKLQKDTKEVLDRQKKVRDFVGSEDWQYIKSKFMEKIVQNSSLGRITIDPKASNDAVLTDLKARSLIASLAIQWLTEIEGDANQYEHNLKMLQNSEDEEIIRFFPDTEK